MQQKKIWTLFLIFGISVLFNSCSTRDIDTIKNVTYVYKNGTAYDLVLEVYDNGEKFKSFSISPNKEVETGTTRAEGPVPFLFYEPTMKYGDSVVIRFSNNRCLSYKRLSNGFGPKIFDYREYDNYTPRLFDQNKPITYTLYYTITVDDYNESVDCEKTQRNLLSCGLIARQQAFFYNR
ncbi:MAG: hypothetical protein KG029_14260 [Bacteroidetes bacterium]|nr:hypothetical protein [Bacteroidota bacterium]